MRLSVVGTGEVLDNVHVDVEECANDSETVGVEVCFVFFFSCA